MGKNRKDDKDKESKSKDKSIDKDVKDKLVKVSEITSFLFCQRAYYFKFFSSEDVEVTQIQALKEIYFSRRVGFENWKEWAKDRFITLYGENYEQDELEILFKKALESFKFSDKLEKLSSVETEVVLKNDKLRITGKLDELVFTDKLKPLILGMKAPKDGVWFRDKLKLAAFCMLLEGERKERFNSGFVYYCCSGELREVDISSRDKHDVIKAVERIIKIQNGFIPERRESRKCENCKYREICRETKETFASKFL